MYSIYEDNRISEERRNTMAEWHAKLLIRHNVADAVYTALFDGQGAHYIRTRRFNYDPSKICEANRVAGEAYDNVMADVEKVLKLPKGKVNYEGVTAETIDRHVKSVLSVQENVA